MGGKAAKKLGELVAWKANLEDPSEKKRKKEGSKDAEGSSSPLSPPTSCSRDRVFLASPGPSAQQTWEEARHGRLQSLPREHTR
jgi:hypothetical protein